MEETERDVKWILIVSLVMYFSSFVVGYIFTVLRYGILDIWFQLANINQLFFIVTIAASSLYMAGFYKKWMYKLSISSFIISMVLLFIQILRWSFSVMYIPATFKTLTIIPTCI